MGDLGTRDINGIEIHIQWELESERAGTMALEE